MRRPFLIFIDLANVKVVPFPHTLRPAQVTDDIYKYLNPQKK